MAVIDSLQIVLKSVDTLRAMSNNLNEFPQLLSAKIDSVSCTASNMLLGQSETIQQVDSFETQLESISIYGIGYSDVASHIALPLIIALFAFAFPFLFTVISHINNKYESDHISWMFSNERSYKWYLRGAVICACYLFVFGIISLCFKGISYEWLMYVLSWSSVFVASAYSAIILWFVTTCIQYNNPQKILLIIDKLYSQEGKEVKKFLKKLERKEKRAEKVKSETKRNFILKGLRISRIFAYHDIDDARIKRLVGIAQYTLKKHDTPLFQNLMYSVNKIVKDNKKHPSNNKEYGVAVFYEEIVDSYLYYPKNSNIENTLMMHWFSAFNRSQVPNPYLIYPMLGKMVRSVLQGRTSLFEAYLLQANYGYDFINQLHIVSYVRGFNTETQNQIDKERRNLWLQLCEIHYLSLAYLFSKGDFEALRIVLSGKNTGYGRLFPESGTDVLKMYARCKEKQLDDGKYRYWNLKDVIGENTDPDMLEKLTAFMLLVSSDYQRQSLNLISDARLQVVLNAKEKLKLYSNAWLNDNRLCGCFPQLVGKKFDSLFNDVIKQLKKTSVVEKKEDNENFLIRIVFYFMMVFGCKEEEERMEDIYQRAVTDEIKKELESLFWKILYGNVGNINNGLVGRRKENGVEKESMGELVLTVDKNALMEHEGMYTHQVFNEISNVFRTRYLFKVYTTFAKMRIKEENISIREFGDRFDKFVGNKAEDYVVIDTDCSLYIHYKMDGSFNKFYKGAEYKHYDFITSRFLDDIVETNSYKGTVVIIKKDNLPYLEPVANTQGPSLNYDDESDKQKGIAAIKLTINPNYDICYSKYVDVLLLKIMERGLI